MVNLTETTGGKAHLSQSCNLSWGNVFLSELKCPTSLVPLQLCHQCHPCSLPTWGYGELDAFIPPGLSMPPCMLLVQNCAVLTNSILYPMVSFCGAVLMSGIGTPLFWKMFSQKLHSGCAPALLPFLCNNNQSLYYLSAGNIQSRGPE